MGVNYVVAPPPATDPARFIKLQQRLAEEHVEISQANKAGNQFALIRTAAPALQLQIGQLKPNAPGHLLIISAVEPRSGSVTAGVTPEIFSDEADRIAEVFREIWPETQQIITADAALRVLYDCGGQHAFKYLWENRLKQSEQSLKMFGRPLQGGGLRLVFPPTEGSRATVEVKIESLLADPSKVWMEALMGWQYPQPISDLIPSAATAELENVLAQLVEFMVANEVGNN